MPLSITRPDPASPSRRRAVMPDLLKSLAIFGVVYIHSGALAGQTAPISYTKALFRFGVPVFILIWAYFQERSYLGGRSWQSVVPQKFLALMIPFAVWSLMYFLLAADFSALTPASAVTRHWLGYGWAGQFFFIILFQLIVVFPLVRRIRLEAWSLVVLFLAFAALFVGVNALSWPDWFIKLGFRPFLYWLPYAFLGIYLARNPQRYLPLGAAAIGFLLIAANPLLLGPHPSLDGEYLNPGLLIGSGLVMASLLNRDLAGAGATPALRAALLLIGASTMGIFVLNPLVYLSGQALSEHLGWQGFTSPVGSLLVSLVIAIGGTAACLAATLVLKRLGLGRLVS